MEREAEADILDGPATLEDGSHSYQLPAAVPSGHSHWHMSFPADAPVFAPVFAPAPTAGDGQASTIPPTGRPDITQPLTRTSSAFWPINSTATIVPRLRPWTVQASLPPTDPRHE